MTHRLAVLVFSLAALLQALAPLPSLAAENAAPAKKLPLGMTALGKEMAHSKVEIKSQDYNDLDGDGRSELVLITREKNGTKTLVVLHQNAEGTEYARVYEFPFKEGYELDRMEFDDMAKTGRQQIQLWLKNDSPDEQWRELSIHGFSDSWKTMFEYVWATPKKDEAPAQAADKKAPKTRIIKFGEVFDDLRLVDENLDGVKEIVIPVQNKTIEVKSKEGGKVIYITGARYNVWRYSEGAYHKDVREKVTSFLSKTLPIKSVEASSSATDKKTKEVTNPPEYFSDSNVGSSWVPGGKKDGVDDWAKIWLADRVPVHAMIVIPGCMESENSWANNNRIKAFTLEFSAGETTKINRADLEGVTAPVAGVKEMPRGETKGASQLLILFDEGLTSRSVKLTVDEIEKGPKGAKTCVSEITLF